jgi:hypothetical protein
MNFLAGTGISIHTKTAFVKQNCGRFIFIDIYHLHFIQIRLKVILNSSSFYLGKTKNKKKKLILVLYIIKA